MLLISSKKKSAVSWSELGDQLQRAPDISYQLGCREIVQLTNSSSLEALLALQSSFSTRSRPGSLSPSGYGIISSIPSTIDRLSTAKEPILDKRDRGNASNQLLLLRNQTDIVNDPFITRIMDGIHKLLPSAAKVRAISELPEPRNAKEAEAALESKGKNKKTLSDESLKEFNILKKEFEGENIVAIPIEQDNTIPIDIEKVKASTDTPIHLDNNNLNNGNAQINAQKYYNRGRGDVIFVVGDKVMVKRKFFQTNLSKDLIYHKLESKNCGPFMITAIHGNNVTLDLVGYPKKHNVFNKDQILKLYENSEWL
ncbi:hypothetical protein ACTFIW_003814 [Dictyostelium discoideum]